MPPERDDDGPTDDITLSEFAEPIDERMPPEILTIRSS
jgi:hypothetical protein